MHDLGPGESNWDSYWVARADKGATFAGPGISKGKEAREVVFLGDLTYNRVHAYLREKHTGAWLKTLDRLKENLKDAAAFYPGHGDPGDGQMFDWTKSYLETYRDTVRSLAQGRPKLTDEEKEQVRQKMKTFLPGEDRVTLFIDAA